MVFCEWLVFRFSNCCVFLTGLEPPCVNSGQSPCLKWTPGAENQGSLPLLHEMLPSWVHAGCALCYGCYSAESVDYPDIIHPLAQDIQDKKYPLGIILCGSGNGAQMTANHHPGVRAALCWNVELGKLARQHNDANILALPGRFISNELGWEIVEAFLTTDFEGGRHLKRINKIDI